MFPAAPPPASPLSLPAQQRPRTTVDSTQAYAIFLASQGCGCHPLPLSHCLSGPSLTRATQGRESWELHFILAEMAADRFITSAQSLTLRWALGLQRVCGHWSHLQGIPHPWEEGQVKHNVLHTSRRAGKTMGSLDWSPGKDIWAGCRSTKGG